MVDCSDPVVRGNQVEFTATFRSFSGAPAEPAAANLYVSYIEDGSEELDTIAMSATSDPSVWTARWDSSGIDPNTVSWSVKATGGGFGSIVQDGRFGVSANNANQVGAHP